MEVRPCREVDRSAGVRGPAGSYRVQRLGARRERLRRGSGLEAPLVTRAPCIGAWPPGVSLSAQRRRDTRVQRLPNRSERPRAGLRHPEAGWMWFVRVEGTGSYRARAIRRTRKVVA